MNRKKNPVAFVPWEILFLPLFLVFALLSGFLNIESQASLMIVTEVTAWLVFGFWFWLRREELRTVWIRRCHDANKQIIDGAHSPSLCPLRPFVRLIVVSAIGVSVGCLIALFSMKEPVSLAVLITAYATGGALFGADFFSSRRLYFQALHAPDATERFHFACLAIALRPSREKASGLEGTE